MTGNEYQIEALRTASGMNDQYPMIVNGVMGFAGEAGECVDIIKKHLFQGHELDAEIEGCDCEGKFIVGNVDLDLMKRLSKAGHPHRKFLRQIMVSCDITAPFYWWKEFDTYKIGTTANSCSTMHKIHAKEFDFDDFSCEHLDEGSMQILFHVIRQLNVQRMYFLEAPKDDTDFKKSRWWQMIQLLPTSYNQKRTITMNYENLLNMLEYRKNHKLDEWRSFCDWILTLPHYEVLEVGVFHE